MASAWGGSWGAAWGDSWGTIDTLIGRKRLRRKGRYHPRYHEIVERINEGEIDLLSEEYTQKIIEQAQEIALARTALNVAKDQLQAGNERIERLEILEARVVEAEDKMAALKDEEDFIIVLALSV